MTIYAPGSATTYTVHDLRMLAAGIAKDERGDLIDWAIRVCSTGVSLKVTVRRRKDGVRFEVSMAL